MFFTCILLVVPMALVPLIAATSGCRCGDAAFLAIPRVNLSQAAPLWPCAAHKLIDARGSGEPQGVSLMFQDVLERLLANNTGAVSQSVVYPAGFDQNVTSGVQNTKDIITYGLRDCPRQKYHLLGYSQGATVVQEALGKLDNESMAAVGSIVLVGNPYRIPGRLSNLDAYGNPDNRTAYGLFATQALKSNVTIPTYNESVDRSAKVADVCLQVVVAVPDLGDCTLVTDHL
ncbi:unnamed protein product [Clonostachys byssicola]|uniref:Cutinase n=1 Tax=Clonostachys byssicola TaxID=160290 RepID=A0A9N9UN59_9HYPO|nr:unnamed protein product [Clonostachys byssicola]